MKWILLENGAHKLKVSDAFEITLHPEGGYAVATGVEGRIGLIDGNLEEQKEQVLRVVISVLMDISEKICPDHKQYGRG